MNNKKGCQRRRLSIINTYVFAKWSDGKGNNTRDEERKITS